MNRIQARYAAQLVGVSVQTIHKWAREGRLSRTREGYDPAEVMDVAENGRDLTALLIRAGVKVADRAPLIERHAV